MNATWWLGPTVWLAMMSMYSWGYYAGFKHGRSKQAASALDSREAE